MCLFFVSVEWRLQTLSYRCYKLLMRVLGFRMISFVGHDTFVGTVAGVCIYVDSFTA